MWVLYALLSALFAGIMAILAKIGLRNTDSTLATALRTIVVLLFAWLMVFVVGSHTMIAAIDGISLVFLILSGLATGGAWLCYFKALQLGDVNHVVPIDKSSVVLTILLSFLVLGERITMPKAAAMVLIGIGTYLTIERKKHAAQSVESYQWLIFALLSAVFSSLTAILSKIGMEHVESNLGTALRTVVVLVMAWLVVFIQGKQREVKHIDKRSWCFIGLSGLATGLSWLFYYRALQEGPASVVVPIDKLSILVTVAFGYFVLHETIHKRTAGGIFLIVSGTLMMLIFS